MLGELRLNPRSPAERSQGRRAGDAGECPGARTAPALSTGFAEAPGRPIHSGWSGVRKEGVG